MSASVLYVYNLNEALVGRLTFTGGLVGFRYANSYLESDKPLAINPIYLPLGKTTFLSNKKLTGPLTTFNDFMPGAWGKAALKAIYNHNLDDYELLLENQQDRVGNLVFNEKPEYPDFSDSRIREPIDWADILKAKDNFEKYHRIDEQHAELFKQGSSQNGARPKLTIQRDGFLHMAKLPTIRDYDNKAQIEHGTLCLAKTLGIDVAQSEFLSLGKDRDIFFTKRFDFDATGAKLPYLSMQSLLGVENSFEASYADFAVVLRKLNGGLDGGQLFKRMVFNAVVSNHDDHYQNHAAYFKGGLWRLTPAFDIVTGEGNRRSPAVQLGVDGLQKSKTNLCSRAEDFGLSAEAASLIVDEMIDAINNTYETVMRENGVDTTVISSIKWAILSKKEFDLA